MTKALRILVLIWLTILTIISLAALCRTFYHDAKLTIDYAGILVGILAALCTVLIGWQIYALVDFNRREQTNRQHLSALKDIVAKMHENGNRGDYLLYDNLSNVYENIISNDEIQSKFERIHFKINAIVYASKIEDFETCELAINVIELFIKKNHDMVITQEDKERLLKYACSIPNQNRIKNYTQLINVISLIKT